MHHQIGVAPNGAGEVEVIFEGQPEMAKILGSVAGQAHAPEQEHGYRLPFGLALGAVENALHRLLVGLAHWQLIPQPTKRLH